jgi:hypothetical protein
MLYLLKSSSETAPNRVGCRAFVSFGPDATKKETLVLTVRFNVSVPQSALEDAFNIFRRHDMISSSPRSPGHHFEHL